MDKRQELSILGIKRSFPQGTLDGACDEIINLRPSDKSWKPVGKKEVLFVDPNYDKIVIHKQDNVENWIGYKISEKKVYHYNPFTLTIIQTVLTLTAEEDLNDILFLKRFMLVITTKNTYRFLYKENPITLVTEYIKIDLTGIENWFRVEYSTEYVQEITSSELSEETAGTEGLLGKYLDLVRTMSSDSRMMGGIFLRFALRLYDGSYILHSAPQFHQFGNYTGWFKRTGAAQFRWIFNTNGDQAEIQLTGSSGSASIVISTEDGLTNKTITWYGLSLTSTATKFVNDNLFYYLTKHIILSSLGSKLIFKTTSNSPMSTPEITGVTGNLGGTVLAGNAFNRLKATAYFDDGIGIENIKNFKDIIDSIVIFGSRNEQFWDISEDFLKNKDFAKWVPAEESIINLKEEFLISDGFKEDMYDSVAWYKIGEIQLIDLIGPSGTEFSGEVKLDLDDYYQDYATREKLPVDNFTHHELAGNASYVYNNRINLADTLQTLATPFIETFYPSTNPYIGSTSYIPDIDKEIKIQIILETSDGKKIVEQTLMAKTFKKSTSADDKAIFFRNAIFYPDSRAKEIVMYIDSGGGAYRELFRSNLRKSKFDNFIYLVFDTFNKDDLLDSLSITRPLDTNFNSIYVQYKISSLTPANPKTILNEIIDRNRVQISEVNNPFVFPSENSNQVGTGVVLALGTNTEPMGVSQFGQYPLIVFTTTGRWIMEIGPGDVYILRVVPLDGDVIIDRYSKLDLAFGVAYITDEGLKISAGKEVVSISDDVDGLQDRNFIDNLNFQFFINHASLVQMTDFVDKIPFNQYLIGAKLGYNKAMEDNEILLSNPSYKYCYVYSVKHKVWYKLSGTHSLFITDYPSLYSVTGGNVVNISNEVAGNIQTMIITRALSFGVPDVFKKLRRSILRCFLTTNSSKYVAFHIFKSNDLEKWSHITGNDFNTGAFKDVWLTHSMSSARFYIYVFIGELSVDDLSIINTINKIDYEMALKMQGKLR